jgi:hypothetical protein
MTKEADTARQIVMEWLEMFNPPPQLDIQQYELLQGMIASELKASPSGRDPATIEACARTIDEMAAQIEQRACTQRKTGIIRGLLEANALLVRSVSDKLRALAAPAAQLTEEG